MPKDKNLAKQKSRFEVRGGVINEFEFHQNQGALAEEERNRFARQEEQRILRAGETAQSPESEQERVEQLMAEAREKAAENLSKREKDSKRAASGPARKGGKKSAKKSGKAVAGKAGAKKGRAKKVYVKKASVKKAAARKAAGKRATRKSGGSKAGKKSAARKSEARRS